CSRIKLKKTLPCSKRLHPCIQTRASSNLPGCGRIMFHIVGCKIRNARNVLIVDSFVLIVRGPETDSLNKSYGRLKFFPRHKRGYPLVASSGSIRKHPEYSVAKSPENLRGPSIMLMRRFAPELNLKRPCHALNDCIHVFKRARVEQFTGLWSDNVSYCWVQNPKC